MMINLTPRKLIHKWFKTSQILVSRSNHTKSLCAELLPKRNIVQISGEDVSDFLQGLITNDMKCFIGGVVSIYTMFLNNRGRILFDSIIYRPDKDNTFLIECDSSSVKSLMKHLNMYKVRRKIKILSRENELNVWTVYNQDVVQQSLSCSVNGNESARTDINVLDTFKLSAGCVVTQDPRLAALGHRIVAEKGQDIIGLVGASENSEYQINRYKLGIAEGNDEIIQSQSFPLEMNCDYLQGVSFDKGCYIGQEVTARTYHTGVVRKRLMPLVFDEEPCGLPIHSPIEDALIPRKSPIGKLMFYRGVYGIGLLRVKETLESKTLKAVSAPCRSSQPSWWPSETIKQNFKA